MLPSTNPHQHLQGTLPDRRSTRNGFSPTTLRRPSINHVHQPRARRSIGFSSELPAPSSPISALSVPSGSPILPPIAAKRARLTLARSEAVNPPLLAPSSSSPASVALDRPMSLNSTPTKETMTFSTSGTRSGSIQAPAVVPPTQPSFLPLPLLPLLLDFPPLLGVYCAPQQLHLTHCLALSIDLRLLFGRASKRRLQRSGRTANIACFAPLPISIYFRSCNCFNMLCFVFALLFNFRLFTPAR